MYPQIPLRFRGNNKGFVQVAGTGGIVTNSAGYRYHTFIDASSTFTVTTRGFIEYLVIGGGGGGGHGGGGGAGGAATASSYSGTSVTYAGGGGATGNGNTGAAGGGQAVNRGGGGTVSSAGFSGVVIVRYAI
jgi:hypothetical protein